MAPKSKRRKVVITAPTPTAFVPEPAREGAHEDPSNSEKGFLLMPVELRTEILDNFLKIALFTETPHDDPILPEKYLARTDALRAVSIDAAAVFHINIGRALERKCDGLSVSTHLRPYIRTVNAVLTPYKAVNAIPKFRGLLQSLENLHTLYLMHTHNQLGKFLKQAFEDGVVLPNIRTLVIQDYCHYILRCCPNVTSLWCVRDNGKKPISIVQQYCKKIDELRGFGGDEVIVIALAKAVPNLRVFEVWDTDYASFLRHLPSFKNFNTLFIKTTTTNHVDQNASLDQYTTSGLRRRANDWGLAGADQNAVLEKCIKDFKTRHWGLAGADQNAVLEKCIKDFKTRLNSLPAAAEGRDIRLLHALKHKSTKHWDRDEHRLIHYGADRCSGKYLEVDLD